MEGKHQSAAKDAGPIIDVRMAVTPYCAWLILIGSTLSPFVFAQRCQAEDVIPASWSMPNERTNYDHIEWEDWETQRRTAADIGNGRLNDRTSRPAFAEQSDGYRLAQTPRSESLASWAGPELGDEFSLRPTRFTSAYCPQILPDGLIYRSYLAGMKEPGMRSMWVEDHEWGAIWDISLGGRAGIFRYGSIDSIRPEGFQIDIEGAALLRLDLEHEREFMSTDFRFGVPLTWGNRRWQYKFAYYHLSSHLGDEFWLRNPGWSRVNYVRDELVFGVSWTPTDRLRFYGEAGWAFFTGEATKPWEFQFGAEYSNMMPDTWRGSPFAAINGHLREEVDFGGGVTVQTGWQWRGQSGHLFRMGLQFYAGESDQYEFWDRYEEKVGAGIWYNF